MTVGRREDALLAAAVGNPVEKRAVSRIGQTKSHVDQRRAGQAFRMADEDRRMRTRIGKVAGPDVPLFHSASTFRVEALAVGCSARLPVLV